MIATPIRVYFDHRVALRLGEERCLAFHNAEALHHPQLMHVGGDYITRLWGSRAIGD